MKDSELSEVEYRVLQATPLNTAERSVDIAQRVELPVARTIAVLKRLVSYGEAERVAQGGTGKPSTWRKRP
jgi:hypothetical protein